MHGLEDVRQSSGWPAKPQGNMCGVCMSAVSPTPGCLRQPPILVLPNAPSHAAWENLEPSISLALPLAFSQAQKPAVWKRCRLWPCGHRLTLLRRLASLHHLTPLRHLTSLRHNIITLPYITISHYVIMSPYATPWLYRPLSLHQVCCLASGKLAALCELPDAFSESQRTVEPTSPVRAVTSLTARRKYLRLR